MSEERVVHGIAIPQGYEAVRIIFGRDGCHGFIADVCGEDWQSQNGIEDDIDGEPERLLMVYKPREAIKPACRVMWLDEAPASETPPMKRPDFGQGRW